MKAFVWNADDKDQPKVGTGRVTPEYKSLPAMRRYCFNTLPEGKYVAEVFHNWDNRYGNADIVIIFSCTKLGVTYKRYKP